MVLKSGEGYTSRDLLCLRRGEIERPQRVNCFMEAGYNNSIGCMGAGAKSRYVRKQGWKKRPVSQGVYR